MPNSSNNFSELSVEARIVRANIRICRDPKKIKLGLTDDEFIKGGNELLRYLEKSNEPDKTDKALLLLDILYYPL